jgi:hypothetical protein
MQKNIKYQPLHLTFYSFAPLHTNAFAIEVPSGLEIAEIPAEIDAIAIVK